VGCEGLWAKNLSLRRWMIAGMGRMFRELCRFVRGSAVPKTKCVIGFGVANLM